MNMINKTVLYRKYEFKDYIIPQIIGPVVENLEEVGFITHI